MNVFFYFDFLRFSSCAVFIVYMNFMSTSQPSTLISSTRLDVTPVNPAVVVAVGVGSLIYQVKVVLVPPDKGDLLILSIH